MNGLQKNILDALKQLFKCDIELIESQSKEECINHRFALYIEKTINNKKIKVDVEYDKYKEDKKKSSRGKNIRPDIIVHKRRSGHKDNLIVIEAKKGYISKKDKSKIEDLVNNEKFKYSLGVGVAYLPNKKYIKIYFLPPKNSWEFYHLNKNNDSIIKTRR